MAVRITASLDDDVRRGLQAEMRRSSKSFKQTVNETLRSGLFLKERLRKSKPFKVRPKDLGLKPGYRYDKPWDLIDEIEGPDYK